MTTVFAALLSLAACSPARPPAPPPRSPSRAADRPAAATGRSEGADRAGAEDSEAAAAISLHLRGVAGDDAAAAAALERLLELRRRHPGSLRVLAYLGSSRVLTARRVLAPWEKGRTCKEGLALLDEAVASAPSDPETRFVRAMSTYPLPSFFARREQCAADLAWLASRWESAVESGSLSAQMASLALLYHGEICAGRGDLVAAREAWERAARLAPEGESARRARARLDEIATEPGGQR